MVRGFEVEPFGGSAFRDDRSTELIARSDRSEVQIVAAGFSRCLHWRWTTRISRALLCLPLCELGHITGGRIGLTL